MKKAGLILTKKCSNKADGRGNPLMRSGIPGTSPKSGSMEGVKIMDNSEVINCHLKTNDNDRYKRLAHLSVCERCSGKIKGHRELDVWQIFENDGMKKLYEKFKKEVYYGMEGCSNCMDN